MDMEERNLEELLEELSELEELDGLEESEEPAVLMDLENVQGLIYEQEAFKQGIEDVARLAGQITGLQNVGLSEDAVLAVIGMLCEKEVMPLTMKHNLEIARVQTTNFEKATI